MLLIQSGEFLAIVSYSGVSFLTHSVSKKHTRPVKSYSVSEPLGMAVNVNGSLTTVPISTM